MFAALNADPSVMAWMPAALTLAESNALAQSIQVGLQQNAFGLWAVEVRESQTFIGFVGLSEPAWQAHFTPCVEIGWRLQATAWGQGYATEAANVVLKSLHLPEVVSFTVPDNRRSRRVMEKLGMRHDPAENFLHPKLPQAHPLSRHVLYRLERESFLNY